MPPSTTTDPSAGALISGALGAFLVMAAATAVQVITITPPHAAHPSAPFVHPVPPLPERSHLHSPLEPASSDEPTTPDDDPTCVDDHPSCPAWASAGECSKNAAFMRSSCRASCHVCNSTRPRPRELSSCEDSNANCATWAAIGECDSNPGYMLHHCPVTCRMCQSATCFDKSDDCAARCRGGAASNFSAAQKCYSDARLLGECAWTCGACAEHRFSKPQCKRDPSAAPAAVPGSVDKIFSSIAAREGATVHSREPWVITVDNFLSHQEADEVIAAGSNHGTGWARSQAGDGIQAARTSSTAWCEGKCLANPTVQRIEARVSELLLGIPMEYSEPMQVLRYETGQFYKVHHDQNSPRASAWGPRMFTVFMYVADDYTGGETHFPRLNLSVPAKKGTAAVWSSVLDSDPYQRDDRTDHESLPVINGTKRGVNYWVHMYPFRGKARLGCGNQAYIENWY